MKVGIIELKGKNAPKISQKLLLDLGKTGAEIAYSLSINEDRSGIISAIDYIFSRVQCLILLGDNPMIKSALSELTSLPPENIAQMMSVSERDLIIIPDNVDENYITSAVIPAVAAKSKVATSSEIFRVFGQSEDALRTLLKDQIKNRNKISVSIEGEYLDYEVAVRYSNKMGKITVDELISAVSEKLAPFTYSVDSRNIFDTAVELLKMRSKTIAVAESFTGGAVSSKLVSYDGASKFFIEGVVAYQDKSKEERLYVERSDIQENGAVSGKVAYEMAAGLFTTSGADIVIATTGYAGSAPRGKEGLYYIAIGDAEGIHIFEDYYSGSREDVIESGCQRAFFYLFKLLSGDQGLFRKSEN